MITSWTGGLARHRTGRLVAAVAGIALAVALVAALGSFLTASKATMTQRAVRSVAVDWQVEVQPGADPNAVLSLVRKAPGTGAALPVGFDRTTGFTARVQGSTQTTGPGMVSGLPAGYRAQFPDEIRPLSGASTGVLLAQQTASNLHAAPGDTVAHPTAGCRGAPGARWTGWSTCPRRTPCSRRSAPLPSHSRPRLPTTSSCCRPPASTPCSHGAPNVITQIHVARDANLPSDPAAAFTGGTGAAHNLEAKLGGRRAGRQQPRRRPRLRPPGRPLRPDPLPFPRRSRRPPGRCPDRRRRLGRRTAPPPGAGACCGCAACALVRSPASPGGGSHRRRRGRARRSRSRRTDRTARLRRRCPSARAPARLGPLVCPRLRPRRGRGRRRGPRPRPARPALGHRRRHAQGGRRAAQPARRGGCATAWTSSLLIGSLAGVPCVLRQQYALVLAPEGVPTLSVSYWAFLGPAPAVARRRAAGVAS